MDRRIKLRHLECLVQASQHRYLNEVAQALHVTPAAVSKTLAELEQIVAHPLVARSRNGLSLTPEGETMVRHLGAGLSAIERGLNVNSQDPFAPDIKLRIGVLPTVAARFMTPAINALLSAYSGGIHISLSTEHNRLLLESTAKGRFDIAVARQGDAHQMRGLTFKPLYAESLILVGRNGHPIFQVADHAQRIAAIADYPLLLPPPETSIYATAQAALRAMSAPEPRTLIETVSNTFGRNFVASTDSLWMISRGVVEDRLATGSIRSVVDTPNPIADQVGLIWQSERPMSAVTAHICDILAEQTSHLRAQRLN
ncbi:MAG: hypothetical protein RL357_816 [Pseudomonadota bacterium]